MEATQVAARRAATVCVTRAGVRAVVVTGEKAFLYAATLKLGSGGGPRKCPPSESRTSVGDVRASIATEVSVTCPADFRPEP